MIQVFDDYFQLYIDHPWASDDQDFTAESKRFLNLIKPFNDATHCSEKIEFEKVCTTGSDFNSTGSRFYITESVYANEIFSPYAVCLIVYMRE